MTLTWNRCQGDKWASFSRIDLAHVYFRDLSGVFIIWYSKPTQDAIVVRVGHGRIAKRLAELRQDPRLLPYASRGLCVTWASVGDRDMDGIEAYLVRQLSPIVREAPADSPPIHVNLPW